MNGETRFKFFGITWVKFNTFQILISYKNNSMQMFKLWKSLNLACKCHCKSYKNTFSSLIFFLLMQYRSKNRMNMAIHKSLKESKKMSMVYIFPDTARFIYGYLKICFYSVKINFFYQLVLDVWSHYHLMSLKYSYPFLALECIL